MYFVKILLNINKNLSKSFEDFKFAFKLNGSNLKIRNDGVGITYKGKK